MRNSELPYGYEIRSIQAVWEEDGRFVRITPYFRGRPISEGLWAGVYGYRRALKAARKAIRLHYRHHVDDVLRKEKVGQWEVRKG